MHITNQDLKMCRRSPRRQGPQPKAECLTTEVIALWVESSIHQIFQRHADPSTLGDSLRHEDDEHVFLTIDPERGAAGTGPVHLADRALVRADAGISTHGKAEAESEARTGQIIRTGHHARSWPDVVRPHIGDGLRAEIA